MITTMKMMNSKIQICVGMVGSLGYVMVVACWGNGVMRAMRYQVEQTVFFHRVERRMPKAR